MTTNSTLSSIISQNACSFAFLEGAEELLVDGFGQVVVKFRLSAGQIMCSHILAKGKTELSGLVEGAEVVLELY